MLEPLSPWQSQWGAGDPLIRLAERGRMPPPTQRSGSQTSNASAHTQPRCTWPLCGRQHVPCRPLGRRSLVLVVSPPKPRRAPSIPLTQLVSPNLGSPFWHLPSIPQAQRQFFLPWSPWRWGTLCALPQNLTGWRFPSQLSLLLPPLGLCRLRHSP